MKKTFIIGLSLTLAMALMATVALAQGPGNGRGYGPGMGYGGGYGYQAIPNLTAEQSAKMQALQQAHLAKIGPLQRALLSKRLELRSLYLAPNPDQATVLAKQKEMLSLQAQMQEEATKYRLEVRKVLTPEQQAQFGAFYGPGMGMGPGMGKMGRMGRW
jgi:Spy/CpxP family protein refolding chaperone